MNAKKKLTLMVVMAVMVTFIMSVDSVIYGGWTITQLTDNDTADEWPAISGTKVVWQGSDGSDLEIYSNFGWQTDNTVEDIRPDISGGNVVWQQNYKVGSQMTYHIMSNFAGDLSYPRYSMPFHYTPKISGENVVWISSWYYNRPLYDNNYNVFSNFPDPDGQLSFNKDNQIWTLAISGNIAVWIEQPASGGRIINSNVLDPIITSFATAVAISGENVVWVQPYQGTHDIFSNFNGRLTFDLSEDLSPAISGTNVVWEHGIGNAAEITTNFGGQVTNNSFQDWRPDISGNTVVWQGWDGTDWEIYMATYSTNAAPVADAGIDQTVEQTSVDGAEVTLDGSASYDPDGDPLTYSWTWGNGGNASGVSPTITLPPGTTTITLVVNDGTVDSQPDTVDITVEDMTAPTIHSVAASPDVLWPPNHKMVEVIVDVDAWDICDPEPFCWILGVTCNEPVNGPGDGNTDPDWELTDDPLVVLLRAERAGGGDGRIYTIHLVCEDISGNSAEAIVEVIVPHDQGKGKNK